MKQINITAFLLLLSLTIGYGQIILDESFEDWNGISSTNDSTNDAPNSGIELESFQLSNNDQTLFINLSIESEINIQSDNKLMLFIDYDNNINTGFQGAFQGAELVYEFGNREGRYYNSSSTLFINHSDIDLITLPTVTSDRFEIAVARSSNINGQTYMMGNNIRVGFWDDQNSGDKIPNSNQGTLYQMTNNFTSPSVPNLDKLNSSDIRIMSFNVLFDKMFDPSNQPAFRRMFSATNPDIIAFQEIYDHSVDEAIAVVQQATGGQWYGAETGADTKIVSRYPFLSSQSIDGNMIAVIDVNGQQLAIINAHLPCCANNIPRQDEIDHIGQVIRNSKMGFGATPLLENTPIIVLGDMNLVGTSENQESLINGDIIYNGSYGPDYTPDWNGQPFTDLNPLVTGAANTTTWYNPFSSYSAGRLDYFLYTASVMSIEQSFSINLRNYSSSELSSIGMFSGDAFDLSDHFPIMADVNFDITSASDLVEDHKVRLFPNPVVDVLFLESSTSFTNYSIFNAAGVLVMEGQDDYQIEQINVADLPKGVYFLKLKNGDDGMIGEVFVK